MPLKINFKEYRRGNKKWTIQRNLQHRDTRRRKTKQKQSRETCNIGTQDEEKQNKNTTQYVLDTTIHKQTQILVT